MVYAVRQEALDELAAAWQSLLQQSPEPAPFLHPAWQRIWLEEFQANRELLLLSVRDGERLIGVAPLLRDDGRLSLVGHHSVCDYMDFVVAPGRNRDFFAALLEKLLEDDWREVELRGLRAASPTLAALPELAAAAGLAWQREHEAVAPCVELPASWEEYLASLSRKDRHELRRKLRRLQAVGELELRRYSTPEQVEQHLPLLLGFMVESRSDKAEFMSERMARFFHRLVSTLAREELVRLYLLELDAKPVAAVLCFDQGDRLYMYNSGYDREYAPLAVGLVSKALCLRDAIESGKRCLDFLRGHEPYKYDLGGKDQTVYRCLIQRR